MGSGFSRRLRRRDLLIRGSSVEGERKNSDVVEQSIAGWGELDRRISLSLKRDGLRLELISSSSSLPSQKSGSDASVFENSPAVSNKEGNAT